MYLEWIRAGVEGRGGNSDGARQHRLAAATGAAAPANRRRDQGNKRHGKLQGVLGEVLGASVCSGGGRRWRFHCGGNNGGRRSSGVFEEDRETTFYRWRACRGGQRFATKQKEGKRGAWQGRTGDRVSASRIRDPAPALASLPRVQERAPRRLAQVAMMAR
jgi:hypothetical protein